jgi:hypothetical protein
MNIHLNNEGQQCKTHRASGRIFMGEEKGKVKEGE